ncbi:MAG: hypothetical protein ABEN55_16755 [Bradymonadaceae bacterium]
MADIDGADASSSGGGPGGYSWWVWIGGGCAVLFVIFGILLAIGAYQGITCCSEAIQQHRQVQKFTLEFADRLRAGDEQWAYERFTDGYKSRTSREELSGTLAKYRDGMEGAVPELMGTHRQYSPSGDGKSGNYWRMTVGYLPSGGETIVMMQTRMVPQKNKQETTFRSKIDEPAPRIVRQFISAVPKTKRKAVRGILAGTGDAGGDSEAWAVVQSNPDVFDTENVDLTPARYAVGGKATVDAQHVVAGGQVRWVRYHLRRTNLSWRIHDIELDVQPPSEQQAPKAGSPDSSIDSASSDAAAGTEADGGG